MENRIRPATHAQPGTTVVALRTTSGIERPPGSLRVLTTGELGEESHKLSHAKTGATVEATVYVESITPASGGRARGVIGNNTGTAIFTVASTDLPDLAPVLRSGAKVTVRGTLTRVGRFPTITVSTAKAVA